MAANPDLDALAQDRRMLSTERDAAKSVNAPAIPLSHGTP